MSRQLYSLGWHAKAAWAPTVGEGWTEFDTEHEMVSVIQDGGSLYPAREIPTYCPSYS